MVELTEHQSKLRDELTDLVTRIQDGIKAGGNVRPLVKQGSETAKRLHRGLSEFGHPPVYTRQMLVSRRHAENFFDLQAMEELLRWISDPVEILDDKEFLSRELVMRQTAHAINIILFDEDVYEEDKNKSFLERVQETRIALEFATELRMQVIMRANQEESTPKEQRLLSLYARCLADIEDAVKSAQTMEF